MVRAARTRPCRLGSVLARRDSAANPGEAGARRSTWATASSSLGSPGRASGWQHRSPAGAEHTCSCVWADGLILMTPVYSDRDEARAAAERHAESGGRWCHNTTSRWPGAPTNSSGHRAIRGGDCDARLCLGHLELPRLARIAGLRGRSGSANHPARVDRRLGRLGPGLDALHETTTKWLPSYASAHGRS